MNILKFIIYEMGLGVVCLLFAMALITIAINTSKIWLKHILIYTTSILFTLFLFECYYKIKYHSTNTTFTGTFANNESLSGYKPELGYGPKPDTAFQVTAQKHNADSLIYDVVYTIKKGQRIVPETNFMADSSILFLGCSQIFGDGLNDNETLPFFVNQYLKNKYYIQNLAFSGYGTHQAAKIVEIELAKYSNPIKAVVYSFFDDHFLRSAGKMIWNVHDPFYAVEDDQLFYKGSFDQNRLFKTNYITKRLKTIWFKSALHQTVFKPRISLTDVKRVSKLIAQMNRQLKAKDIRFMVFLRESQVKEKYQQYFLSSLQNNKIEYYLISDVVPHNEINQYKIKGDVHPNKLFNEKLGRHIAALLHK